MSTELSHLMLPAADLVSPPSPTSPTSPTLHKLENKKSVRPFRTNDEYLYAMKEDLAVWFNQLYASSLTADNLLNFLQDGTFLCHHANNVKSYIESKEDRSDIPDITYRSGVKAGSFQARDNVANFISWVKHHLGVNDVLLFESDDLVMSKNEKNVVLCILEVARRGARYGMIAPMLIQFEQEIDALEQKIKRAADRRNSQESINPDNLISSDTDSDKASLDEWVQRAVHRCTCPKQFPLINVSRGKYRVGYTQNVVFVRILRNHVMIRVGGGWDTLEHYLDKHDPCRCRNKVHLDNKSRSRHSSATTKATNPPPVHSPPVHSPPVQRDHCKSPELRQSKPSTESKTNGLHPSPIITTHSSHSSGVDNSLSSTLVISRDETGCHLIGDSSPMHKTARSSLNFSPQKQHYSAENHSNLQPKGKTNGHISVSSVPDDALAYRSESPSQELVRRFKENFRTQTGNTVDHRVKRKNGKAIKNQSRSRDSSLDRDKQLHRKVREISKYSRNRSSSTHDIRHELIQQSSNRSRSLSRPSTPELYDANSVPLEDRKTFTYQASPRRYRKYSNHTIPTRIPLPIYLVGSSSSSSSSNNNNTINYRSGA